eukprot:g11681.t1
MPEPDWVFGGFGPTLLLLLFHYLKLFRYDRHCEKLPDGGAGTRWLLLSLGAQLYWLLVNLAIRSLQCGLEALGLEDEDEEVARPRCPQALADQFVGNASRLRQAVRSGQNPGTRLGMPSRPDEWNCYARRAGKGGNDAVEIVDDYLFNAWRMATSADAFLADLEDLEEDFGFQGDDAGVLDQTEAGDHGMLDEGEEAGVLKISTITAQNNALYLRRIF